ncbi:MAG TPA: hypothetical protein VFU35_02340 [Jatrophihabitans sp.]|nr:hypothetical protein [Jatrophihabitans sp.]
MSVRLRRGIWARCASSGTQFVLTLFGGFAVFALIYGAVHGRGGGWTVGGVVALVVLFVPWIAGLTAWARVDDDGIRWRYWLKYSYRWEQITRITLTNRDLVMAPSGFNSVPTIVVHGRTRRGKPGAGFEDSVRPVEGTGRNRRAFADAVVAAARAHGTKVVVSSRGWNQPMPEGAQEKSWN